MITSLRFEHFRIFPDLEISPIKGINLIAGANNTGKTAILEGLYLLFASDADQLRQLPSAFRSALATAPHQGGSDDFATFWQTLFYDRDLGVSGRISAVTEPDTMLRCNVKSLQPRSVQLLHEALDGSGKRRPEPPPEPSDLLLHRRQTPSHSYSIDSNGHVQTPRQNPVATTFIALSTRLEHPTRDADLYNQVTLLEGGEERLLGLLREVDPRLQKLRYAKAPGTSQPLVYAHFGLKNALSITQAGQGFSKLFSLFCQMLVSKAKVLLIDEIENGIYYETFPQIWKGIATLAASEKIQVFATTHSRECVLAAHETMKALPNYDFALHRIQRVKGLLESVTHDQGMLETAIKSGLEVR